MLANSVFGGAGSAGGAARAGELDKSPSMKPRKNRVKAPEVEKNEGRERKRPDLPFRCEWSRVETRTALGEEASTAQLNGLQSRDVSGQCFVLLGLLIQNVSTDARGDSCSLSTCCLVNLYLPYTWKTDQ